MNTKSDEVINTIKNSGAKMRSRRYFIAQAALVIVGAILLFLLILFVATFVIFALQENGGFFAINFGPVGWGIFLESLPWSLLLLSLALILVLWILLRRYEVVYHQPFLYTLLILIVVISLSFFFLSANAIHGGILHYVSRNQIPVVSGVYEFETAPISDVYRGQVIMLATSSFIFMNALGQTSTVFMVHGTAPELKTISPGSYILIFGHDVTTTTIHAYGVEKIMDY